MSALTPGELHAVRTGEREWIATNDRGGVVKVGDAKAADVFSPGELLVLALATCGALSADHRLTHALGDDLTATLEAEPIRDRQNNRYTGITARIGVDLSALDDAARERLDDLVAAAIERSCTVGRTLATGTPTTVTVEDTGAGGSAQEGR